MNLLIPVPDDWRDIIKAEAEKNGESLSEFVRAGIVARLPDKARRKLSAPPKMGRPKKSLGQ